MQDKDKQVGDTSDGLTADDEHKVKVQVHKATDTKSADVAAAPAITEEAGVSVSDEPTPLDDPKNDELVDEISAHEGDELLAADDEKAKKAADPKKSWKDKIKGWCIAWWDNKRARYGTIAGVVVLLLILAILPPTRSFALNLVGVRGTAEVTVLDNTTSLPLKNAKVQLGSETGVTNASGDVTLKHVKLGKQTLTVQKVAFAVSTSKVNVSWGTNHLGQVALRAVGTQYHFSLTDFVSGKPIAAAQASSGQANATSDTKGLVILTANSDNASSLQVTFSATGYHSQTISVPVGITTTTNVALTIAREEVYISKQSGKYDVYKSDVDGKNKTLLLAGTGNENDQITLVSHPTDEEAALVSTRDSVHDSDGYLEQTLTLINVSSGAPLTIEHSDRVQLVDWIGNRLVYVLIKPGSSAANPERYEIMSYDYTTKQRLEIAHANYFNDIESAGGIIYYASSNNYGGGVSQFGKVNADGTGQQVLLTDEVWNMFRVDYTDFSLSGATGWYNYVLGATKPTTVSTAPTTNTNRVYSDSPDGKHSLWVDSRDGKGALVAYDTTAKKDTVVTEQSGLTYPVRWLNNSTVIYRVSTPQETADYVISMQGGSAKKIADVTDVSGFGLWYGY